MSNYTLAVYVDNSCIQFVFFSENEEGRLHTSLTPSVMSFFRLSCDCIDARYYCDEHCIKHAYHDTLDLFKRREEISFPWANKVNFFFHVNGDLRDKFKMNARYHSQELIEPQVGYIHCTEMKTFFKVDEFEAYLRKHNCKEVTAGHANRKHEFSEAEVTSFLKPCKWWTGYNAPSSSEDELDEVISNWEPFTRFKRSRSPFSEIDMLEEPEVKRSRFDKSN